MSRTHDASRIRFDVQHFTGAWHEADRMDWLVIILVLYVLVGSALGAAWIRFELLIHPRLGLIFSFIHILLGWPFYGMVGAGLLVLASLIDQQRANTFLEPRRRRRSDS